MSTQDLITQHGESFERLIEDHRARVEREHEKRKYRALGEAKLVQAFTHLRKAIDLLENTVVEVLADLDRLGAAELAELVGLDSKCEEPEEHAEPAPALPKPKGANGSFQSIMGGKLDPGKH